VSRLFWLGDVRWAATKPHLPMVHKGPRRLDDRQVISGIPGRAQA
jgi:transposase